MEELSLPVLSPSLPYRNTNVVALCQTLERHGWEVRNIDIDLIAERAIVEIHRFDGRWVHLSGKTHESVSIERWHRTPTVYRYRGGPQCDGFNDQFLGRSRPEGLRTGLRSLCKYIADNPAPGFSALDMHDVRRLFANVMQDSKPLTVIPT